MTNKKTDKIKEEFCRLVEQSGLTPAERSGLARELFDGVCEALTPEDLQLDHLSAPNAVVEIIDAKTGTMFRRYLEIELEENDNGIRLIGENMSGEPAQIVFLSEAALHKMHELRGQGPDTHKC